MTIKETLSWAVDKLREQKVEGPLASAEFLLRQILSVDKSFLISHPEETLSTASENKFKKWVERRAKHEPVWYITGKIDFYGQDFLVSTDVLIPRPETELFIERIISKFKIQNQKSKILDIGTGSGAIILTLANELGVGNEYFASDLSDSALKIAKRNAKNLGFSKTVSFKQGDLFGPWNGKKFDFIVANLPYIPHEDMATMAFDITHYEPRVALDGGVLGLEIYQRFFDELPDYINSKAKIYCEIGDKQGKPAIRMAKTVFPDAKVDLIFDYAGFDRFVIVET